MPRSTTLVVKVVLFAVIGSGFAGCGFAPAAPGGAGAANGGPLGAGNSSGTGLVGGGAAQNGQGAVTGMNCAAVDQPLNRLPPDILIVLDASGSMNEDSNNTVVQRRLRRELQVGAADAGAQQVVMQTQADGELGSQAVRGHGQHLRRQPQQRRGAHRRQQRGRDRQRHRRSAPTRNGGVTNGSRTPTRSAENAAVTYLRTVTTSNPKFILLATDGQPNCPASGNTDMDDSPGAVMSVANAQTAGFPTFVVGISAPAGAANDALNMMAVAGGYPRAATPRYYPVTSAAEFITVLRHAGHHRGHLHVPGPRTRRTATPIAPTSA